VHIRQTVAALSPARSAVRYEHAVQTDAGEVRWQEWSDRAIFDAAGRLTGLQSVGRDITDRKQTEQLLQRAKHRMFVRDIADDPIDYTMVKSINELAHVMGKQTIAEFVENRRILEKVQSIGVDFAQGYGIARPRPLRDRQDSDATKTSSYPDQE